jgi:hypothetical protein
MVIEDCVCVCDGLSAWMAGVRESVGGHEGGVRGGGVIWLVWKTGAYEGRRDEAIRLKFIFNFEGMWRLWNEGEGGGGERQIPYKSAYTAVNPARVLV